MHLNKRLQKLKKNVYVTMPLTFEPRRSKTGFAFFFFAFFAPNTAAQMSKLGIVTHETNAQGCSLLFFFLRLPKTITPLEIIGTQLMLP